MGGARRASRKCCPPTQIITCVLLVAVSDCRHRAISCPRLGIPAVSVYVLDSATSSSIGAGSLLRVTGDGRTTEIRGSDTPADKSLPLVFFGPPGVYDIEVSAPNHEAWQQAGIRVEAAHDPCSTPIGRTVFARLRPAQKQ